MLFDVNLYDYSVDFQVIAFYVGYWCVAKQWNEYFFDFSSLIPLLIFSLLLQLLFIALQEILFQTCYTKSTNAYIFGFFFSVSNELCDIWVHPYSLLRFFKDFYCFQTLFSP